MITIRQGKTLTLQFEVVDKDMNPIELTGAEAVLAYLTTTGGTVVIEDCLIEGNVVSVSMSSLDTSVLLGSYDLEVKLRDVSGNVDDIYADRLTVIKSVLPVFPVQ